MLNQPTRRASVCPLLHPQPQLCTLASRCTFPGLPKTPPLNVERFNFVIQPAFLLRAHVLVFKSACVQRTLLPFHALQLLAFGQSRGLQVASLSLSKTRGRINHYGYQPTVALYKEMNTSVYPQDTTDHGLMSYPCFLESNVALFIPFVFLSHDCSGSSVLWAAEIGKHHASPITVNTSEALVGRLRLLSFGDASHPRVLNF